MKLTKSYFNLLTEWGLMLADVKHWQKRDAKLFLKLLLLKEKNNKKTRRLEDVSQKQEPKSKSKESKKCS